ncbi:MAG: hypothetical protein ACFE9I_09480 [Candidatus Hermodarchaeota archaeon]
MAKKIRIKEKKTFNAEKVKGKSTEEEIVKEEKSELSSQKEEEINESYLSDEDLELDIPLVPEAPKKKNKLDTSNLSTDVLERMKKIESPEVKVVLVNCERCRAVIPVPIPKKSVLNSDLPVVPISYVHKNLQNEDQHCLTIHLDHDFDIRRQRISDVVISSD